MTAWDASRSAQRRPLRKPYKPCAPVAGNPEPITGTQLRELNGRWMQFERDHMACGGCGYHVCSCERHRTCTACKLTKEPEGFGDGNVCLACELRPFTLADGAKAFAEYNFPIAVGISHGQTAPDISSGTAFTLKPAAEAEFVPHAYMRMGSEFRWGHRIYVNPRDPRVRGSVPSEGP